MYIERVPNRTSAPTLLLRESYRKNGKVCKRTLANLSKWSPEAVKQLESSLKGGQSFESLATSFEIVRSRPHGHVLAVLGTLTRIQLDKAIGQRRSDNRQLVIAMIVARILDPASKLSTARQLNPATCTSTLAEDLSLPTVNKDSLYRALDWLVKRQAKIEQTLASRHLEAGSIVLVDLSSTYLEGETCELAKRGYSRDRKKGVVQITFSLLCNAQGCPIAVEVFEGNTTDPTTLSHHLQTLTERFNLATGIIVGDRGTLPDCRIESELKPLSGWLWVTALKAVQIQALFEAGHLSVETFETTDWIELSTSDYPDERLIACRNPQLASHRHHRRQALLSATETELDKVLKATQRAKKPLQGKDKIGLRVGKVINRFKMAKHFQVTITETNFSYQRDPDSIETEARLDGIYVIRTSVPATTLDAPDVVTTYKSLSQVESAFRCLKAFDLHIRPIFHRLEQRVRAHVLLCLLAYYVEWHMRRSLAPILFAEDDPDQAQALRTSVVQPAQRSESAKHKAGRRHTCSGVPVHSFRSLLADLATMTKNTIQPTLEDTQPFEKITLPTPTQRQAFELLNLSV